MSENEEKKKKKLTKPISKELKQKIQKQIERRVDILTLIEFVESEDHEDFDSLEEKLTETEDKIRNLISKANLEEW